MKGGVTARREVAERTHQRCLSGVRYSKDAKWHVQRFFGVHKPFVGVYKCLSAWDVGAFVGVHKPFVGVYKCLSAWDGGCRCVTSRARPDPSRCGTTPNPVGSRCRTTLGVVFDNDFFSGFFAKSREHLSSTWLLAKGLERFLEQMDHASRDFAFFFSLLTLAKT